MLAVSQYDQNDDGQRHHIQQNDRSRGVEHQEQERQPDYADAEAHGAEDGAGEEYDQHGKYEFCRTDGF